MDGMQNGGNGQDLERNEGREETRTKNFALGPSDVKMLGR